MGFLQIVKIIVCIVLASKLSNFFKARSESRWGWSKTERHFFDAAMVAGYATNPHYGLRGVAGYGVAKLLTSWHRTFVGWLIVLWCASYFALGI